MREGVSSIFARKWIKTYEYIRFGENDKIGQWVGLLSGKSPLQFVIFKTLRYCFEKTIDLDIKALFARRPVPRLIKTVDTTKEF